jgi:hypothetical protein
MTFKTVVSAACCLAVAASVTAIALVSDEANRPDPGAQSEPNRLYCPTGESDGLDTSELVGRSAPNARRVAADFDCTVRVVRRDGKWLAGTDDFRENRINVALRDQRVARVTGVH